MARIRSMSGSVALAVLVVAVPLALIPVGNAASASVPEPRALIRAVEQGHLPSQVVVGILLIVAWAAWAQLAWAVVWEAVSGAGRRVVGSGPPSRPAPMVVPALGRMVSRAMSGGVGLALLVGSLSSRAGSPAESVPVTQALVDEPRARAGPPTQSAATARAAISSVLPTRPIGPDGERSEPGGAVLLSGRTHGDIRLAGGSPLLAFGALESIRDRRRYGVGVGRSGDLPPPAGIDGARVERLLMAEHGRHPVDGGWLRAAMMSIADRAVPDGGPGPAPVWAVVGERSLMVTLDEPEAAGLPWPWTVVGDGSIWEVALPLDSRPLDSRPLDSRPGPSYGSRSIAGTGPALVSPVEGVLLSLDAVGRLAVGGPVIGVTDTMIALVVELAMSMTGTGRLIRVSPALTSVASAVAGLPGVAIDGGPDLVGVRRDREESGSLGHGWVELGVDEARSDADGDRGRDLIVGPWDGRRSPAWRLELGDDRSDAVLEPIGLRGSAPAVSGPAVRAVAGLLREMTEPWSTAAPSPGLDPDTGIVGRSTTGPRLAARRSNEDDSDIEEPSVLLLGPVEIRGIDIDLTPQQRALVAFLAVAGQADKATIVDALWDGRPVSTSRFPNLISETRRRIGHQHLPEAEGGRYRLAGVGTDLERFTSLTGPGSGPDRWVEALALVRGEPLTVPAFRYWGWIADRTHVGAGLAATIADVAVEICSRVVDGCDQEQVIWACRQALRASPLDERLTALLADAYRSTGRAGAARRLVDGWEAAISRLEG